MKHFFAIAVFATGLCAAQAALAQSVAMSGLMGDKAILIINGAPPKMLSVGQSHQGVKLLSVNAGEHSAQVEITGKRTSLRVGGSPVSVGSARSSGDGKTIVIPVGSGGHFSTAGFINGRSVNFMVDTGATTIAMGTSQAQRLGVDYRLGVPVQMATANGMAQGWRVTLRSLRINDVELYDIDAIVGPDMPVVLLGNNFLSRFSMKRTSDVMVLERNY